MTRVAEPESKWSLRCAQDDNRWTQERDLREVPWETALNRVRRAYFFPNPFGWAECHFQAVATMGSMLGNFTCQLSSALALLESA